MGQGHGPGQGPWTRAGPGPNGPGPMGPGPAGPDPGPMGQGHGPRRGPWTRAGPCRPNGPGPWARAQARPGRTRAQPGGRRPTFSWALPRGRCLVSPSHWGASPPKPPLHWGGLRPPQTPPQTPLHFSRGLRPLELPLFFFKTQKWSSGAGVGRFLRIFTFFRVQESGAAATAAATAEEFPGPARPHPIVQG